MDGTTDDIEDDVVSTSWDGITWYKEGWQDGDVGVWVVEELPEAEQAALDREYNPN